MRRLMGWLHETTWIDVIVLVVFMSAFWAMVLALATSLFGGQSSGFTGHDER